MPEFFSGVQGSHAHTGAGDGGSLNDSTLIDSADIHVYLLLYGGPSS